jgi:hypothetical protein
MGKSLLDLATSLEKKSKLIEKQASDAAVSVALTIVGDLAYITPVDTSQALSNWITTLSTASNSTIAPQFFGSRGSTKRASAAETINSAIRILASKKPGQVIYITNNLFYIRDLNDGSSSQAPAGFVERSVLIGRKLLSKFKIKDL